MKFNSFKKIITAGIVSVIIGTVLTVIFTNINYNNYIKSNNQAILRVISAVLESGKLSKDEIVILLENDAIIDENILKNYGYDINTKYFLDISEENLNKNIIINLTVVNSLILMFFLILILNQKNRNKKINELIFYLQELNNKNYTLKINDNSEDELSKLKNELYQITIFLKEQAEKANNDKILVKDNIINISHQLKTPITSMSIMLDNIIDFPNMDEKTKSNFILTIRENVFHIEFLIQNMLKLSRFDANVIEFKNEKIRIKDLLKNSLNKLQSMIDEKEIEMIISGDNNAFFMGDFRWQSEAISNIIKNAIEHSNQNGKIDISYSMNNFYSKIRIKDYGIGIKKENLHKVFTRYYKDENSSESSLGVGLNLAKTIIEKDFGTIKLSSKENKETIFEIKYLIKKYF